MSLSPPTLSGSVSDAMMLREKLRLATAIAPLSCRAPYTQNGKRVCRDVIDLRRRLIVPGAPRARAVDAYDDALIAGDDHAFACARIDPQHVMRP